MNRTERIADVISGHLWAGFGCECGWCGIEKGNCWVDHLAGLIADEIEKEKT